MDTNKEVVRRKRRRKKIEPTLEEALKGVALPTGDICQRLNGTITQLGEFYAERTDAVRCIVVALLCGFNYLLVGPRGTAKTALSYSLMQHIKGGVHFSTLLGSFSTLNDLIGRIDLAALQRGEEKRKIEGKLLDCDTAFLDEALKGSDGVLNSLLGLLGDNRDFEGKTVRLWSVGSATNWPEVERRNDKIAALYDRFHLKIPVSAVASRAARKRILTSSRLRYVAHADNQFTLAQLCDAAAGVRRIAIDDDVLELMCSVQERCVKEGIDISDRKLGQWQHALQAEAWLKGNSEVGIDDFTVLVFMAWDNAKDIDRAKGIIASCDLELSQGLIKKVDAARKQYQAVKSKGLNATNASEVLDVIIQTADEVGKAMKKYKLRDASKRDVARAVKALQGDFEALHARFQT